ncbi:MAG: hypothetical protein ACSHX6_15840 [Akkermansiaceae bacterium]
MKTAYIITLLVIASFQDGFAQAHLSAAKSPVLSPVILGNDDGQGVWIPGSYGGVINLEIDIETVGTDEILKVQFKKDSEFSTFSGRSFQLQSDKTVKNEEKGTSVRTVILISNRGVKKHHANEIICYKIHHYESRVNKEGILLQSEATNYRLTFSRIKNDYEVEYLIPFSASFPNAENPKAIPIENKNAK